MVPYAKTDIPVQNILVLTDFSACSQKALLYAANIARRHNSKLTLLHIVAPQFSLLPQPARRKEALRAALGEMKQFQAGLVSRGALRDIQYQLLVRPGKTWKVISRILELQSTDLVVIGTRGRTGLKKLILGSFAQAVFRKAPCPVLTVGPGIPDQEVSQSPRHILFPTDESHASKAAEPYAFQLGRGPGVQLTHLRVLHGGSLADGKSGVNQRLRHARERLHATGLYAAWREGGTTPNVVAEMGPKVKTILRVVDRTDADLVILGIAKGNNAPEIFGWADAYQVVCSAHCPVLTVRHTFPDPYFKRLFQHEPLRIASNLQKAMQ